MNAAALGGLGLRARLALARHGGAGVAASALLVLGAAGWLALLPALRVAGTPAPAGERSAAPELAGLSPSGAGSGASRVHAFHAALGDVRHLDTALQALFAAAERSRISVDQAEYKLAYDKAGRFWTYAVQMPVAGSYAAIRGFAESALLALPCASLDEIDFHRKDIAQPRLDARLRFTLHLDGPPEGAPR